MNSSTSNREELLNWDKYISNCENISGLSTEEKKAAKEAMIYLREKLGDRFLLKTYHPKSKKTPHPLGFAILNQVASTRLDLIKYAEALQAVEGSVNFNRLLKRFKDPEAFSEGCSVLEVSLEFYRAGFQIEFEPQVLVIDQNNKVRTKFPDLRVISNKTNETAIVEVTELKRSANWKQSFADSNPIVSLIFSELSSAGLIMWADMNSNFNSSRVEETLTSIQQLIEDVKQSGEFQYLITDCIQVGITPENYKEPLKEWAEKQGISPGISGPPIESNELIRMVEKIKGKLSQLPATESGIIVIPATQSGLLWQYEVELIVGFLAEKVRDYSKVFGIVVIDSFFDGVADESYAIATSDYAYVNRHNKGVSERSIIIFNKNYGGPMSYTLLQQLRRAFLYI